MTAAVDAHVHTGPPKYAPVERYESAMREHGLERAVLVQHLGNTDNAYLLSCLNSSAGRFAALGIADDAAVAGRLLDQGFAGLRMPPVERSENAAVWETLEARGAVVSVTGPYETVAGPAFRALVRRLPRVTFRLEHFGWFRYASLAEPVTAFQPILDLATEPNVTLMWSGYFANSAEPHPHRDAWPLMRASLDAYGAERIMWSGDWNRPDGTPADYQAAIDHLDELPFLSDEDRRAIRSETAARIFGLHDSATEGAR